MFNRPRCRDWTPLATQQLRLRNLIQISGQNIICEPNSSIYFTLHMSSMSAPFFTSEKSETPNNAIWAEIICQSIIKSGSRTVCIRVWQHNNETGEGNNNDKVLFLWGIYFSGLIPLKNRTKTKLKENTLILQMHGGYFTSIDYILPFVKNVTNINITTLPITIDNTKIKNTINNNNNNNNSLNCDGILSRNSSLNSLSNSPSKSNSPDNKWNFLTSNNKIKSNEQQQLQQQQQQQTINKNNEIRDNQCDLNELKKRYIIKDFLTSEIRPSYDTKKLLLLQEKQRFIKYKQENSKDLMERICMKSAYCLNLELIANRPVVYTAKRVTGMGRTLNKLLFQQPEPTDPEILIKAQELRRKIEIAKFRCRLLVLERDRTKITIRHLENKLGSLSDGNIETESWLMAHYMNLSKEREFATQQKLSFLGQQEVYSNVKESLYSTRLQLLKELNQIYIIKQSSKNIYSINNIILPDAESYTDNISPLSLSVALGFAAHATMMCSILLNTPLRNPIKHKGSQSKIIDEIKLLPASSREFPLYCKETPPPNELLYAVFLLNQNIAQLKYSLSINKGDLRATLPNLFQLLGPIKDTPLKMLIMEHTTPAASISSSSVDLNVPVIPLKQKMFKYDSIEKGHRICRSVGSYNDENFPTTRNNNKNQFSSEPILTTVQTLRNFNEQENI